MRDAKNKIKKLMIRRIGFSELPSCDIPAEDQPTPIALIPP
jgi:hypothetical protein